MSVLIKPLRKVSFADNANFITLRCCDEPSESWYADTEILGFRTEARDTCRKFQQCGGQTTIITAEAEQQLCLQGLGLLLSHERKQNRLLANRGILKTQQCCRNNQELLATIAQELTAWAKEVARSTAVMNYYEVYFPNRCLEQPHKPTVPCPLAALRKRLHNDESNTRCVRQCRGPLEVQV